MHSYLIDRWQRYALLMLLALLAIGLATLHAFGLYPRAGLYDLSKLRRSSIVTLEGRVLDLPSTRWRQTRFLFEGEAQPLSAFEGKVIVSTRFEADIAPGDRLRLRGYLAPLKSARAPKGFDEQRYWGKKGTFAKFTVWHPSGLENLTRGWSLGRLALAFREKFCNFWRARLMPREAALVLGLTMGGRGILPPKLKEDCVRAGVYHLVVVSGQNMSFVILVALTALAFCRVPSRLALILCLPTVAFYTLSVGAEPPVVRAGICALVTLLARVLRRDIPRIYPLAWAALLILAFEPSDLFGASFQLSFGACLSLWILFALWESDHEPEGWKHWFWSAGRINLAVHLGIGPLLIYYFQRLSLASFLAPWTVFPLASVLTLLGLVGGLWGLLMPLPDVATDAIGGVAKLTLWVIHQLAAWPWSSVEIPVLPFWVTGVYYSTIFGILHLVYRRKNHAPALPLPPRRNRLQP